MNVLIQKKEGKRTYSYYGVLSHKQNTLFLDNLYDNVIVDNEKIHLDKISNLSWKHGQTPSISFHHNDHHFEISDYTGEVFEYLQEKVFA